MKLSLRQKRRTIVGLLVLAFIAFGLVILGMTVEHSWLESMAIGITVVSIALNFVWWRCPNCGEWLGRNGGKYCSHCGEKIDFDAK